MSETVNEPSTEPEPVNPELPYNPELPEPFRPRLHEPYNTELPVLDDPSLNEQINIEPNPESFKTLIYPTLDTNNKDVYKNILLIDSRVKDYEKFIQSSNSDTLPIVYSIIALKSELLTLLQNNFTNISRIGIVFQSSSENTYFLDNEPFFKVNETIPYSENTQFMLDIIKQFNITNVDYLACDTLNDTNWVNYYNVLMNDTGVIIGASNDQTGNIKYGGNWIMESNQNDIESIYFSKSIEYYTYLLDTLITIPYTGYSLTYNLFTNSTVASVYSITTTQTGLSITIPSSIIYDSTTYNVASIGVSAFINRTQLVSVTIPDTVTTIGNNAFSGCINISSVTLSNNLLSIGDCAFAYIIPQFNTTSYSITNYSISTCLNTSLTQITLPNTLRSIGKYAFFASGLISITFPESVTTIDNYAFYMCTKFSKYYRDSNYTQFNSLLPYPTGIITFLHKSRLPFIGLNAFITRMPITFYGHSNRDWPPGYVICDFGCSNIAELKDNIYGQRTGLDDFRLGGYRFTYTDMQGLQYYIVSTEFGYNGTTLEGPNTSYAAVIGYTGNSPVIRIPFSISSNTTTIYTAAHATFFVTTIHNNAFQNCTTVEKILIPGYMKYIGLDAFKGCTNLVDVTFGGYPKYYGDMSFNIQTQKFNRPTAPAQIGQAFDNHTNPSYTVYYAGQPATNGQTPEAPAYDNTSYSDLTGFPTNRLQRVLIMTGRYIHGNGPCYIINDNPDGTRTARLHDIFSDERSVELALPLTYKPVNNPTNSGSIYRINLTFTPFLYGLAYNVISIDDYAGYGLMNNSYAYEIQGNYLNSIGKHVFSGSYNIVSYIYFSNNLLDGITIHESALQNNAIIIYPSGSGHSDRLTEIITPPGSSRLGVNFRSTDNNSFELFANNTAKLIGYSAEPIPSTVTYNNQTYTVTDIGYNACHSRGSIVIPDSVTLICDYAFQSGTFTTITIPANVSIIGAYVFYDSNNLTTVNILSNKLTYIGEGAFYGCDKLTSINIPNNPISDTIIDEQCFNGCSGLTSVTLSNSVRFRNTSQFTGCSSLTTLTIPNGVTTIPRSFCNGCTSLTSISMPNTVTSIGDYAFFNCTSLPNVTIPFRVTTIGAYAFRKCLLITTITIPSNVVYVGTQAFYETKPLSIVNFLTTNILPYLGGDAYWPNSAIMNVYSTADRSPMISPITNINFNFVIITLYEDTQGVSYRCSNGNATIIGYNSSLPSITIPYTVTTGNITYNVTAIGDNAFYNCSILESISLPSTINSMGVYCFYNCINLKSMTINTVI